MPNIQLVRFCNEYLCRHPELAQSIGSGEGQKLAQALVHAGAEAGFAFSEFDIHELLHFNASSDLSDNDLEAVAGGSIDANRAQKEQVRAAQKLLDQYKMAVAGG